MIFRKIFSPLNISPFLLASCKMCLAIYAQLIMMRVQLASVELKNFLDTEKKPYQKIVSECLAIL